jgi:hypothetical protein
MNDIQSAGNLKPLNFGSSTSRITSLGRAVPTWAPASAIGTGRHNVALGGDVPIAFPRHREFLAMPPEDRRSSL